MRDRSRRDQIFCIAARQGRFVLIALVRYSEGEVTVVNEATYDDYWLGYLAGHARPLTRVLHYFGLFFGQLLGLYASFAFAWWAALIICLLSYLVAYLSHEWVEGNSNKPYATRPVWSVVSFFRMLALDLTGQLHRQTARLTPEHFAAEHP